jgi:hypothetical protein
MKDFLLVYRRSTASLVECRELGTDRANALAERFSIEKRERRDPDVEVVILSAPSKETLMRTHSRYFKTLSELASDFSSGLAQSGAI